MIHIILQMVAYRHCELCHRYGIFNLHYDRDIKSIFKKK